jgi:triosephosphate isomerase
MTARESPVALFTSLKMYFGQEETRAWSRAIAKIVQDAREQDGFDGEVAVFPGYTSLHEVAPLLSDAGIALGAQDVAADEAGAQTGEVSARVLAEVGCTFVEIGHAERRAKCGETDDVISRKVANAVAAGLVPLVCVGESETDESDAGAHCSAQLTAALDGLRDSGATTRLVVAYEPVWAIGAAESAPPSHVAGVVRALRRTAAEHPAVERFQVIYGGSVSPETAAELGAETDGLFLGRYVHDPEAFGRLIAEHIGQRA